MISVLIPAKNEAPGLVHLLDEIEAALAERDFEVIVIDDGSTDATAQVLAGERGRRAWPLRIVRHEKSCGKSMALRSGVRIASGAIAATLDGDGQNNPVYLAALVDALEAAGPEVGIAAGQRVGRKHSRLKNAASRFANKLRGAMLQDSTRDSACGLKAVRTDIFRRLPFFDGTHRFLPALVLQEGYGVVHIEVEDRPRAHGTSHYGIVDRGLAGAADLLGVWWLKRRRARMPKLEDIVHD